jgi:hypothetical protein
MNEHRWEHLPKKLLVVLSAVIIILMSTATGAQDNCGDGLPCGRIPWSLIVLPPLSSPTPAPTLNFQVTSPPPPSATPSGPATGTPGPAATIVDGSQIGEQVSTLQAVWQQTPIPILDASGTPVSVDTQFQQIGSNAGTIFGYARTLSGLNIGRLTPLITFFFTAFVVVVGLRVSTFVLPFLATVFGIVRKAVQLILDFIPG